MLFGNAKAATTTMLVHTAAEIGNATEQLGNWASDIVLTCVACGVAMWPRMVVLD
jgi:hypothetical protein